MKIRFKLLATALLPFVLLAACSLGRSLVDPVAPLPASTVLLPRLVLKS